MKLTIGLVYRSPNINEEDGTKIKNAIKEVSKGECIIMGDFNHGHIQWNSLESTGSEDQQFLFLIQDSFLTQHVLEPTRGENVLDIVLSSQKEVSKGECIIMGDFNHGHIQWNSLESTGSEDQQFLFLIQDSFLTQHVLEPTRGENVLDIVLSSQKELVDNVKIREPLGNSDHNQIHFDINVKSESKNKKTYNFTVQEKLPQR